MNYDEFITLAKGMKAVCTSPSFLPDKEAMAVWYQLLQDLDYKTANIAIQKHMLTNKFPPTIAEIRELATGITAGEKPLWPDGWEETIRAIKKYGYYRQEEALESLSELARKVVKRLGYKQLCMSEEMAMDRANFRMVFEQIAEREYREKQLPSGFRNAIKNIKRKELKNEHDKR